MEKIWRSTVDAIEAQLTESDLREVVMRLRPVAMRGDAIVVEAPGKLAADVVRERCLAALERALVDASSGALRSIALTVPSVGQQELFPPPPPPPKVARPDGRRSVLLPKYTVDNFVVDLRISGYGVTDGQTVQLAKIIAGRNAL